MSHSHSRILDDMASHVDYSAAVVRRAFPPGHAIPTPSRTGTMISEAHKRPEAPPTTASQWKYHFVTGGSEDTPLAIDFGNPRSVHGVRVEGLKTHTHQHVSEGANRLDLTLTFLDSPKGKGAGTWVTSKARIHLPVGRYTVEGLCAELERAIDQAIAECYNPSFDPSVVAEELGLHPVKVPYYARVVHTAQMQAEAQRNGEAWRPLEDFVDRTRWTPRTSGGTDELAFEVLEVAQIFYRSNPWAWRELADERDPSNRYKWPFHAMLHRLMSSSTTPLPNRLVVSIHHLKHFDAESRRHWLPYATVPSFTLEVPRGLQRVLGLPMGIYASHALSAELPPLARYFDGRDSLPVGDGDQGVPSVGDHVQCVVGREEPLAPPAALLVNVYVGDTQLPGRIIGAGVRGAACGVVDGLQASPQVQLQLDHVESVRLAVVDECGNRVDGWFTALIAVK